MTSTASGWHRKTTRDPASLARKRQYNSREHKQARGLYATRVAAGTAQCWRCHRHIRPGTPWHVGHDETQTRIAGPEHATCNLNAAASKGARIANARRKASLPSRTLRRATRRW